MTAFADSPKLQEAIRAGLNKQWGSPRHQALWAEVSAHRATLVPRVAAWRDAAVADGWSIAPTYGDHESVETAFTLQRDGFKVLGLLRAVNENGTLPTPSISLYGPDGAIVDPPEVYSMAECVANLHRCDQCGAQPVKTGRFAFANRCCTPCGEKLQASLPSNWCD